MPVANDAESAEAPLRAVAATATGGKGKKKRGARAYHALAEVALAADRSREEEPSRAAQQREL